MISSITNSGLVSAHATIRNIDTLALKTHDRSLIRKISFIDTKRNSIYLGAPRSHGKSVCRGNYTYHFGFNGGFKRLYRINNLNGFNESVNLSSSDSNFNSPNNFDISPDGSLLVYVDGNTLRVINILTNTLVYLTDGSTNAGNRPGGTSPSSVWYTADGSKVLIGFSSAPNLVFYNTSNWSRSTLGNPPATAVTGISISPSGNQIAVALGTASNNLLIYDSNLNLLQTLTISTFNGGSALFYNNTGTKLYCNSTTSPWIRVYNTTNWTFTTPINVLFKIPNLGCFSPLGDRYFINQNSSIYMFNSSDGYISNTPLVAGPNGYRSMHVTTNGEYVQMALSTGGDNNFDNQIVSFNILNGMRSDWGVNTSAPSNIQPICFTFSKNKTYMAYGGNSNPYLNVFKVQTREEITIPVLPTSNVRCLAFTPDETRLIVGLETTPFILIYNTSTWAQIPNPVTPPTGMVWCIDVSPNGTWAAIGHNVAPFLSIYQISNWNKISNPSPLMQAAVTQVRFSPDNSKVTMAVAASPFIRTLNVSSWSSVPNPSILPEGVPNALMYNAESSVLYIGMGPSPYFRMYNASSWDRITNPTRLPAGPVEAIAINNKDRKLYLIGTGFYIMEYDLTNLESTGINFLSSNLLTNDNVNLNQFPNMSGLNTNVMVHR